MKSRCLLLVVLPDRFAICRLAANVPVPAWIPAEGLVSITRTADELSIVCPEQAVPEGVLAENGWRCLGVAGKIPFSEVGVLASLVNPLAEAGVSVFTISTFDTDYVLVKDLEKTVTTLRQHGHMVQGGEAVE